MSQSSRHVLHIDHATRDYPKVLDHVISYGEEVANTIEVQALTIVHHQPWHCLVKRPNANLAIGAAEALQLIGGFSDPATMVKIAPQFADFLDGGAFHGAYGPRVRHQLEACVRELRRDRFTRRARMQIWNERDIATVGARDYPCTIGFTFQIRNGKLDMHAHMRSNDAWWGWTYDVTQFCLLQLSVASVRGLPVGTYYHHAESFHLYTRDYEKAAECVNNPLPDEMPPTLYGIRATTVSELQALAFAAFYGEDVQDETGNYLGGLIKKRLAK